METIDKLKYLDYFTEYNLPRVRVLFAGVMLLLGLIVFINSTFITYLGTAISGSIYLLLLSLWVAFWMINKFRLPRAKKDKLGIIISIYSENEAERHQLKSDFINKLKEDFRAEGLIDIIDLIFLQNHFALDVIEAGNQVAKIRSLNKKIKAHFYIWGDIKRRNDGDKGEKYYISFNGYVVHGQVTSQFGKEFAKDFSMVLPKQVNFLENKSYAGFEVSAKLVHLAAKYIIGIAALVTYDPFLALKLHHGLKEQFNAYNPLPPHLKTIRDKIPILISDEHLWIARWNYEQANYDKAKEHLGLALSFNENSYGAWLFKSIIDFTVDENYNLALKSVNKARSYAGKTHEWRYNEAFLRFWIGDYNKALELCGKIRRQSFPGEDATLAEVRKFNLSILASTNDAMPQLYFWIGYLAYFKERNYSNSLQDFEKFEELCGESMGELKRKSSAYLIDIKREMGLVD